MCRSRRASCCLRRCASGESASRSYLFIILNQRENIEAGELCAAVEEGEFHGERGALDFAAEFFDELRCGARSAARCEKIVANQYALAGLDGVFMNFQGIRAVLECVGHADGSCRKFFRLA